MADSHTIATSLPDDLWEAFEAERAREDRNIAQHLRVIVRRYFEQQGAMATMKRAPQPPTQQPLPPNFPWAKPHIGDVPQTWPGVVTSDRTTLRSPEAPSPEGH